MSERAHLGRRAIHGDRLDLVVARPARERVLEREGLDELAVLVEEVDSSSYSGDLLPKGRVSELPRA